MTRPLALLRPGWLAWLLASSSLPLAAQTVVCHVNYGGEDRTVEAPPVDSPYGVKGVEVGSYFIFRVVNQTRPADLASVKVYAYTNHDDAPAPIHQATYSPAQVAQRLTKGATHGFTGLHHVYEPVRDGEMQYWCEWRTTSRTGPRAAPRPASAQGQP